MKLIFIVISILMILSITNGYAQQNENNDTKQDTEKIKVIASFYPFYEIAKEIGGNNTVVTTVIPFGVEPHDWEITPQQIPDIMEADMIIYNGIGFDAWFGKNEQFRNSFLVDISKELELIKLGKQQESENFGQNPQHDDHTSRYDPHIWLDPILVKNISKTISNALIKLDPDNTKAYEQNTKNFNQQLDTLDSLIKKSLANCELKNFITFHESFHYFANRYGLVQHPVHGSSPEGEILPQQIIKIISLAKDLGIDTIYSEELKDPRLSQTLASEIPNGKVLLLSPIEGIDQEEQKKGINFIDKMKKNFENLKQGLKCK
ncbi:MAG: metal ABC transporter solute-binding protein, Zn/Mn family [Nitrososphaeraceae archaeon]